MKKIKTMVFGGGEIHDWKGIQPELVEALSAAEIVETHTVQNDLSALENLDDYDVLVFHYTVGTITDAQRDSLSKWLASGKGFVGIHSAADSFRDDPDYRNLVGGHFITHPRYRQYQVSIKDPDHLIVQGIEEEFWVTDEQYIVSYDPRVHVLASALWKGEAVPVAWTKSHGKGRVFYLALGHDVRACGNLIFRKMLLQGVMWAALEE
jgi:hypothetical protein